MFTDATVIGIVGRTVWGGINRIINRWLLEPSGRVLRSLDGRFVVGVFTWARTGS